LIFASLSNRYAAELSIPPESAQKTFLSLAYFCKNWIADLTNFLGFFGGFSNL
jgi:hypothetical protein